MTKGIVDPWRVVAPLHPVKEPVREPVKKIDIADIDMDVDLKLMNFYVIRSKHASIRIDSRDMTNAAEALILLVKGLAKLVETPENAAALREAPVGFSTESRSWNPLKSASTLAGGGVILMFGTKDYDQGIRALVTALNKINRRAPGVLAKYGISTLMR